MKLFAERVKSLMKEKQIDQKTLSKLTGISEPSLCRYLKDENGTEPRIDILMSISKALGVAVNYLVCVDEKKELSDPYTETVALVTRNRSQLKSEEKNEIIKILLGGK